MFMHHFLEKYMNPNCAFYHAQSNELYTQYAENVCTFMAPGMDYIRRRGAADIQVPYPVESKGNREN